MSDFSERGKAMENKFFHNEEINFKAISRRRKLLGLWAAEQMNYDDNKELQYALSIVGYGVEHTEDAAVVDKILLDMVKAGVQITEKEVRNKMSELHREAIIQLEQKFQKSS